MLIQGPVRSGRPLPEPKVHFVPLDIGCQGCIWKNAYKLLNRRAPKFSKVHKIPVSFNEWVKYFVWNFKGTLWNSTQNVLPIQGWWCLLQGLTHFPLDKMAANLADDIFCCIFLNENVWILIKISLKFVPKGPIDNETALVQVMDWRRTGHKPLSEPMLTHFTDRYSALWGNEPTMLQCYSSWPMVPLTHWPLGGKDDISDK